MRDKTETRLFCQDTPREPGEWPWLPRRNAYTMFQLYRRQKKKRKRKIFISDQWSHFHYSIYSSPQNSHVVCYKSFFNLPLFFVRLTDTIMYHTETFCFTRVFSSGKLLTFIYNHKTMNHHQHRIIIMNAKKKPISKASND